MKKLHILFLGAPGSGKGTQAGKLSKSLGLPHIDTGSMLRVAVSEGTELGKTAKQFMDLGKLVPIEIVTGIIKESLQKPNCEKGFILDGYPRSVEQAESLDVILKDINKDITAVLNIEVAEGILVDRMAFRRTCKVCGEKFNLKFAPPIKESVCDKCEGELLQRSDDSVENAERRIQTYKDETAPLVEYYSKRNLLINIDGNKDPQDIFNELLNVLGI